MDEKLQYFIAMASYMAVVIAIGAYYAKRANQSSENFFLGGRSIGPWVTAMSAEASDMSGWLLMGLPGLAYFTGLGEAVWTAIGLAVGTYLNWLIVAKRLRRYSSVAGDSITVPDFLSNRFKENKKVIMTIAALFILIFFTVYASSCFVTCGKLFSSLFGLDYKVMMIVGAAFVVLYTFLGGFLAESVSDFMQSIVMIFALTVTLIIGVISAGGISQIIENIKNIPGFLDFFGTAQPVLADNVQKADNLGNLMFGPAGKYGLLSIISALAWGLGYFGMPQVLLRFMAIRKTNELTLSRRVATIWVLISLAAAVCIGLVGRSLYFTEYNTLSASENIFTLVTRNLLPPLIAGVVMAGIIAAAISSSDSYLLIASSAFAKNIFQGLFKKDATDKQVMVITRITLLLISIIGIIIALDEQSVIFKIVSFAWAGFGATFGPIILFSLFWKRTTREGAIAGMISGGVMVFIWKLLIAKAGGVFAIYELFPSFVISSIFIYVVSLISNPPSKEIEYEFNLARNYE